MRNFEIMSNNNNRRRNWNNRSNNNSNIRNNNDYDAEQEQLPQQQQRNYRNNNNNSNYNNRNRSGSNRNQNNNNYDARPRQRNPPPPATNQGNKPPVQKSGPSLQPKHTSDNTTAEKNDPMVANGVLIEGLSGYTEIHQQRKFAIDMSGFNQLLRSSYDIQTEEADRALKKYVPFGVWAYYHTILMWKAFYRALGVRSDLSSVNLSLENLVPDDLPCATDIANYIEGIGNIVDDSGRHVFLDYLRAFSSTTILGSQGSFGRVSHENHFCYETMIAPLITLLKIKADLELTDNIINNPEWDLPNTLRPSAATFRMPNENLLGWRKAERLTDNQRDIIRSAGISQQNFSVINVGYLPINQHIIQAVASYMLGGKNPNHKVLTYSTTGSIAQIPYAIRVRNDTDYDGRSIASKQFIGKSASQYTSHIASGAAVFRYRFNRVLPISSGDAHSVDYLCYSHTGDYPATWINNANTAFVFGVADDLWNTAQFSLPEMNGYSIQMDYARNARKKTTRE